MATGGGVVEPVPTSSVVVPPSIGALLPLSVAATPPSVGEGVGSGVVVPLPPVPVAGAGEVSPLDVAGGTGVAVFEELEQPPNQAHASARVRQRVDCKKTMG